MQKYDYDDVQAVSLDLGLEGEICQIMYSDEYKRLMGLLRALMVADEMSERALHLSAEALEVAPSDYTAWNYRYRIVKELYGADEKQLDCELDWLDMFTLNNLKNYQIWSYRQALLQLHPKPLFKRELPVLLMMLDEDSKNYHVWSYRKWVVLFFGDFTQELQFATRMIERDVYNNSAWVHRMFVLKKTTPSEGDIQHELDYVRASIELAPQNASSWNYLRGLYDEFRAGRYDEDLVSFALSFTGDLLHPDTPADVLPEIRSSHALELLAHIYSQDKATHDKAKRAFEGLASAYDPIRSRFWSLQLSKLV
ncbi:AaceriACR094Cp [[Ashbya] aceris (nom. inval.)]|nr:AaceriACR094Cp [[Ashbya] aceris (nom. inval.)]